jgi:hypothetical protein
MKKLIAALFCLTVSTSTLAMDLPKEAHCEPQMDDACTVNNKKVPIDDLKKYLPVVNADKVSAAGGYCEYPICYDVNDNPVGLRDK